MLTQRQLDVLAHVVPDPQAWYEHAVANFGQAKADEFAVAKVARWESEYDAALARGDYKTRAQRDQEAVRP